MAANLRCLIFTPYVGTGKTDDPYRPLLNDKFNCGFTDVTGQLSETMIPKPNLYLVETMLDASQLSKVSSDTNFKVLLVQDMDAATPDQKIDPTQKADVEAFLTDEKFPVDSIPKMVDDSKDYADLVASVTSELVKSPKDKSFGAQVAPPVVLGMPLSSQWTWSNVIQPVARILGL